MPTYEDFIHILKDSKVVTMPKNNIRTFGNTTYNYYFLGKIDEENTYLCEGNINVNNPLFITPFSNYQVDGFSDKMKEHFDQFLQELKISNHVLVDYRFENITRHNWEENSSMVELLNEIKRNCRDNPMSTILVGKKDFWEPSLMKFCLKILERSLPYNITEIEEKGFLNEHGIPSKMLNEIEERFKKVEKAPHTISYLGNYLVDNDIFELYEERFFELMERTKTK